MLDWSDRESPFHTGEQALQTKAGVRERAEQLGQRLFRDFLPDQHREFYPQLPLLVIGSIDAAGRPWASLLSGPPGFVRAPHPRMLTVAARPIEGDPLAANLHDGAALGVLGIQLETRRRNRVNGRVAYADDFGFMLRVDQTFGNCPKYITARTPAFRADAPASVPPRTESARLSPDALACIAASDTSFIASASAGDVSSDDPREGVDVSHRGGKPGFVRVHEEDGASVLTMPDFVGNNAFNTFGNLARHPRAGLLFVDFARGRLLSLTGTTEIVWEGEELASFRGALRLLRVRVTRGLLFEQALPFTWSNVEPAAQLAATGSWAR